MLVVYEEDTLDMILIHPTATEITDELAEIIGERNYGFLISDVPFDNYAKIGATHNIIKSEDGEIVFLFHEAPKE